MIGNFYIDKVTRFKQFFKYAFVGGVASIVDWSILYVLTNSGIHYLISTVFGFLAGWGSNFFLSKKFVFKEEKAKSGPIVEFFCYGLIGVAGLCFTLFLMHIATEVLGIYFMISKVIITALVLIWNYLARKIFLYKK